MTTPTPQPLDLGAIRARADAATPGSWATYGPDQCGPDDTLAIYPKDEGGTIAHVQPLWADAEFIAHAREDVPALLAEVEALRTERDGLAAVIEEARDWAEIGQSSTNVVDMSDMLVTLSAAPSDALAEVKREAAAQARAEAWSDATIMARAAEGAQALGTLPDALDQCAAEARAAIREGR